ncbi:hypothetical protein BC332_04281 [Capsicum chinense]|nr:hypothetical protein BC332_04281 [Capsicum chinense]
MKSFIVYTKKSFTTLTLALGVKDLPTVENELEPFEDGCIGTAFCVHRGFLEKVVLSSSPSKANCMVASICGRKCNYLAYCKLGDESWTCIVKGMMGYDDAIFDHEKTLLYAVTFTNHVHVFDLFASPKLIDTTEPPLSQIEGNLLNCYLIKTSMGLFQVAKRQCKLLIDSFVKTTITISQCQASQPVNAAVCYCYENVSKSLRCGYEDRLERHVDLYHGAELRVAPCGFELGLTMIKGTSSV